MISACSKVEDSLNRTSMDRAERRQRRLDHKNWGGGVNGGKKRDASRGLDQESVDQRASKCGECGSEEKKLTRGGPLGPRTLCNACGLKWAAKRRARNAARNLQDTSSEGESVEEAVQERGAGMYIKDLERKLREAKSDQQRLQNELHVSDANVNTFRKLNDQKQNKIDELETLVESLRAKIGEISSTANGVSSAVGAECARLRSEARCVEELRTEVRILEETNGQLVQNMQRLNELLSKNFSAGKEIVAESIQINGDHITCSWRSGAVTEQQQQTAHYQESKKASNVIRTKHDGIPPGFEGDVDVDVDADIGDNEPDYHVRRPERTATGNIHDDPVHVPNGVRCSGSDTAGKSRDHEWERGYHGRPGDPANDVTRDRRRDEVRPLRKDVERRSDRPVGGVNGHRIPGGSSGEGIFSRPPLISLDDSNQAREYVEQSFITWVNSTFRKPTPEELVYHKTKYTTSSGKTCYWAGIAGREILGHYADAFPFKKVPNSDDLEFVLKRILHVEYCAVRPAGLIWCLVWLHCVKIEELPGYHVMVDLRRVTGDAPRVMRDMRRPRSPLMADDDEGSVRSLRQRCA